MMHESQESQGDSWRMAFITPNITLCRCIFSTLQPFLYFWNIYNSGEQLARTIEISRSRHEDLCNVLNSGLLMSPGCSSLHDTHIFNHLLNSQVFGISKMKICYFWLLEEMSRDFERISCIGPNSIADLESVSAVSAGTTNEEAADPDADDLI